MKPTTSSETHTILEDLATVIDNVAAAIGRFQVQLALGEAEAVDLFTEQKRKVVDQLNKAENYIGNLIPAATENPSIQSEIDRARLKMEILRLHFHFPEMSEETRINKMNELRSRINLLPRTFELHDHLLSVEEEIKAAQADLKNKTILKTK